MDYGSYAATYGVARWAVPWVLAPLERAVRASAGGGLVVDVGCGTGNYLRALRERVADRRYAGLDLSHAMLAEGRRAGTAAALAVADADRALPVAAGAAALAFSVDVLHHLVRYDVFFAEVARVLAPGGSFVAVTDLEENLRKRSLTRFFPEILQVELARYPRLEVLDAAAEAAGLRRTSADLAEGWYDLDDRFVAALGEKCSSAMRLISDDAHRRGLARVAAARARGERWLSSYAVLTYGEASSR
jgi:SAM-dependent methyltransferase